MGMAPMGGLDADPAPVHGPVVVLLLGDADPAGDQGPGQAHERDAGGPADAGEHEGDTGGDGGAGGDVLPVVLQPVPGGREAGRVLVLPLVELGVAEGVQAGRVGEGDRVVGGVRVRVAGPAGPGGRLLGVGAEESPGRGVVDAGAQQLEAAGQDQLPGPAQQHPAPGGRPGRGVEWGAGADGPRVRAVGGAGGAPAGGPPAAARGGGEPRHGQGAGAGGRQRSGNGRGAVPVQGPAVEGGELAERVGEQ